MKIAVVGSREFKDIALIQRTVHKLFLFAIPDADINPDHPMPTLISGGARGVDSIAEEVIDNMFGMNKKIFKPEWDKFGKSAGAIRNQKIVDESDKIVAFWDGDSKGTKITIDMAIKAGKPIDIYVRN